MKLAEPSEKALSRVTDPELWREAVHEASREALDSSGGERNWHARAAQRAVQIYKSRGGGYLSDEKPRDGLVQWQEEEWVTLDPKTGNILGPCGTEHEDYPGIPLRCLPRERAQRMSPSDRQKTARIKADAPVGENVRNVDQMGRTRARKRRVYNPFTSKSGKKSSSDDLAAYIIASTPGLRHAQEQEREQERQGRSQSGYYIAPGDESGRAGIPSRIQKEQHRRQAEQTYRATQEDRDKRRASSSSYGRRYEMTGAGRMRGTMTFTDPETGENPVIRAHNAAEKAVAAADNVYLATEDPVVRAEVLQAAQVAEEAVKESQKAVIDGDPIGADEAAALAEDAAAVAQAVEQNTTGTVEEIPDIDDPDAPPTTEADAPEPRKFPVGLALLGGFFAYQLLS